MGFTRTLYAVFPHPVLLTKFPIAVTPTVLPRSLKSSQKFNFLATFFYAFFCPGTMTTHAESINSDLQRGLDRRLRHTQQ